ncbi:carboxylesterase/lipase family protein [Nocardia sp. NPDC049149]|uniref:carboxylesterase/lipase family protein n=1 Tax=Nocardia sp. NPDC049149 TaxID=3364315 RepID=UPI003717087B
MRVDRPDSGKTTRGAHLRRLAAVFAVVVAAIGTATACGGAEERPATESAVVDTQSGPVRGMLTERARVFSGIPYAAPPVGELRWKPPVAPAIWSQERDATKPGAQCPQRAFRQGQLSGSEDCLFLNVSTPRTTAAQRRPVMVWIHGGAFTSGSGNLYDPSRLVNAGDLVVVTINYRLGALGFLGHPALAYDNGQVGNFGLLDQQAALRWVRDNIAAFGGDPAKVTIAGESAGAMSVCDHLVSPASDRLFHGAILQSGPCQLQADRQTAVTASEQYAQTLGCAEPAAAQCLRAVPAEQVAATPLRYTGSGPELPGPIFGQPLLPEAPLAAFRAGKAAKVPVLIGLNSDEGTLFALDPPITAEQYPRLLQEFGAHADAVAAQYPLTGYPQPALAWSAVLTDNTFACPIADASKSMIRTGPVYAYEFADRNAAPIFELPTPFPLGASHAFELPYLFDMGAQRAPASQAQRDLSDKMIRYWSAFVRAGDPNGRGLPDWPRHTGDQSLVLKPDALATTDVAKEHRCGLWQEVSAQGR